MNENKDFRKEFLFKMYDQMFNNIGRHILTSWQALGLLIGIFAVYSLVEKELISLDIASSIMILSVTFIIIQIFESNNWFQRNQVILTNIEKQFLDFSDLREIHYFFGSHRPWKLIEDLKTKSYFATFVGGLLILHHVISRLIPMFQRSQPFEWSVILPYFFLLLCFHYCIWYWRHLREKYEKLLRDSPGKEVINNHCKEVTNQNKNIE